MKNIKAKSSWGVIAIVLLAALAVLVISWKHDIKSLPPVDYIKYVNNEKNGLNISKHIDDVNYTIQYRPVEYMVANEQKNPYLKTSVFESEKGKYDNLEYYFMQIATSKADQDVLTLNLKNQQDYTDRQKYYSFGFENDICLVEGSDTLHCAIFNYVPNYGIAPHIDFMLAFEKNKQEITSGKIMFDRTFVISDQVMGYGTIKLNISKEDLSKAPSLTTY
jgi:hypothetical protein